MQLAAMTPYGGNAPLRRQAVRPPAPAIVGPELPGDEGVDIRGLFEILRRRWLTVLIPALVLGGAALAYVTVTPKLYTTSTLMLLDPRVDRVLQSDAALAGAGFDAALVESQVRVVTSDAVFGRVVDSLNLANVREFGGDSTDPAERRDDALGVLEKRVAAARADRTYLMEIKATARDPRLARDIANAVAASYLKDQEDAGRAASRRVNEALTSRLTDLKRQLRDAEQAVQAYRAKNNLVGPDGSAVTSQQIAELNQRLIQARAVLASAQARYDQVRRSDSASSSAALASTVITALRTQMGEIARREADLSATYGDNHPAVVKVRAELASVRAQIAQEIARISESARNDLAIAQGDVAGLQAELDRLTGRNIEDAGALIELRELQRNADATRALYEAMLARAKESAEQQDLATTSVRILAPAGTPSSASFPPLLFILGVAIALGLGSGAALALVREGGDDRIRTAAQLRRIGLDVLAVVPPFDTRGKGAAGFDYSIRLLRAELRDPPGRARERSALIVPTRHSDGAAALALNLALASVASGERVLLVDADAAHRTLTTLVAPDAKVGLAEVLTGRLRLEDAIIGDGASGLQALPLAARSGGYRGRPARAAYDRLIEQARPHFDYIIFVGAPLADEPDARAIAEATDQIALVMKAGTATRRDLNHALRALRIQDQKTCGVVLNMAGAKASI
jgi:uncharacterized protein involved in exopolysaccharide biosynthesis/Mrp family chromosome partitioning ATPase